MPDDDACIYWRALSHLGTPVGTGCAIDHLESIGKGQMAEWLLSVKARLEQLEADPPAR